MSPARILAAPIYHIARSLQKFDGVRIRFGRDLDVRSYFPFINPEREEVHAEFQFVLDGEDFVVVVGVLDLVETLYCEEALVPYWALGMFGPMVKGRHKAYQKQPLTVFWALMIACLRGSVVAPGTSQQRE